MKSFSSAEFYGEPKHLTANLELVARFFEKYPEYAQKAFLSVKVGHFQSIGILINGPLIGGNGTRFLCPRRIVCLSRYSSFTQLTHFRDKNLVRSVDKCLDALRGAKHIDLFELARLDKKVPLEHQLQTLMDLQGEGKFDYIGLSEVRADTIRRATKVSALASLAFVQVLC